MHRLPAIMVPLLTATLTAVTATPVLAAANHLLISEIQSGDSESANNEYIELFNPTDSPVDLTNLRLQVGTSNLIASMAGSLAANQYYLIAKPAFTTLVPTPDAYYSASSSSITANSYLTLYGSDHTTILDRVGMGTATLFETTGAPAPTATENLHRTDPCLDSDNNAADFTLAAPSPQNSSSSHSCSAQPTSSPTLTPTPTTLPDTSPTSAPTSTPTPAVTLSPTLSPTPTAAPLPTATPTVPSVVTATPLPTPTSTPAPWPPAPQIINTGWLTCTIRYQSQKFFGFTIYFPKVSCVPNWFHKDKDHDHDHR